MSVSLGLQIIETIMENIRQFGRILPALFAIFK